MSILEVKGLSRYFGGLAALNNLDLTIRENEIRGIIGPNGAGKTTLLAQLSGQTKPDSGDIEFSGSSIINDSMARRAPLGLARSFQITRVILTRCPVMPLLRRVIWVFDGLG